MTIPPFPRARIVFQTIVDLNAWRVTGFEALARFDDGGTPPAHLRRAETLGLREDLELLLIKNALEAMTALPEGMAVTVNASGATVLRSELPGLLDGVTRPWGIEIYEGATTADLATVRATVNGLGGTVLVDDAGAVCADESRIAQLRPDVVKIDRTLFWQIADDADAEARLDSLLGAARDAGAKVLVEGISDADQVERARRLGADFAQGFHLGMPTPAEDVALVLAELHRSVGLDAPGL